MISKGVFWQAKIPRAINKGKVPTWKFGHFWPKSMDFSLRNKSIFGRNINIPLKASNRISVSQNVPWGTFWASQGTSDKEIAKKRWSQGKSRTAKSLSGRYWHFKMIPKGLFRHAEISKDINKCNNADLKIWSHLAKKHGRTPWKKVDFWSKYKYFFQSF